MKIKKLFILLSLVMSFSITSSNATNLKDIWYKVFSDSSIDLGDVSNKSLKLVPMFIDMAVKERDFLEKTYKDKDVQLEEEYRRFLVNDYENYKEALDELKIQVTNAGHELLARMHFDKFHSDWGCLKQACARRAIFEEKANDLANTRGIHSSISEQNSTSKLAKLGIFYNSFWDKLKDNPRKSMGAIAALAGTALVFKKRSKIKKYFGNKIDSLKETYADVKDRYQELREMESQDIKDLVKMELEEKLDDFKANYFNRNFLAKATGVGIATAAAIAIQKKYSLLQKSGQYAKLGLNWLDKNSVNYFQNGCDLAKNNPAIVLPVAGAVYMGGLFNFFKAKTCQSNIQDFIRSLNSKQTELLRDSKFMLILSQAYDNPEVLEKSKEFMEILTEQQIKKLSKIVNNHKANRKALIN